MSGIDQLIIKTKRSTKMARKSSPFENVSWLFTIVLIGSLFYSVQPNKNVLFFIVPNFRSLFVKSYQKFSITPAVTLLSSESLTFHNAFSQIPSAVPSRNSLFTSRRPDTLKSYDGKNLDNKESFTSIPEYFKSHGYQTYSVGKVFPMGNDLIENFEKEWSYTPFWPKTAIYDNESTCLYVDKKLKFTLVSNLVCPIFDFHDHKFLPDQEIMWAARKFIKKFKKSEQNFFLSVGFFRPEPPLKFPIRYLKDNPLKNAIIPKTLIRTGDIPSVAWNPANNFKDFYDMKELNMSYPFGITPLNDTKIIKQCYLSSITYIDDLIGQILQELIKNSLFDKTMIVVTGDHGCSLGERGLWGGHCCFDTSIKVPLLMYIPHVTTKMKFRKITHELVELVDLFPTLVDLAGLPPLETCPEDSKDVKLCTEGFSLISLIRTIEKSPSLKEKEYSKWKTAIFSQVPRPNICPNKLVDSDKPPAENITIMGYVIRTSRFKYIEWVKFTDMKPNWDDVVAKEFYDYSVDEKEALNLALRPQLQHIMDNLRSKLKEGWRKCQPSLIEISEEETTSTKTDETKGLDESNVSTTNKMFEELPYNKTYIKINFEDEILDINQVTKAPETTKKIIKRKKLQFQI